MQVNEHIVDYLDWYSGTETPRFAVLLNGEWGCGKTWFIKNYIKNDNDHFKSLVDDKYKSRFLYISLYGVKDSSDIDKRLFFALHPTLSGKYTDLLTHIATGAVAMLQCDPLIEKLDYKDFLHAITGKKGDLKKILVFDDLERCSMPVEPLLGYINSFVEHDGMNVIVLAFESEIDKQAASATAEDQKEQYLRIKEKLIGKTFTVHSNADEAFDEFLSLSSTAEYTDVLKSYKDSILHILRCSDRINLRVLRYGILEFGKIFNYIDEDIRQSSTEIILEIIQWYFILLFEISNGAIRPDDIKSFETRRLRSLMSKGETPEWPVDNIPKKYPFMHYTSPLIPYENWCNFFENGHIDKEQLNSSLRRSRYFINENTPTWQKLWRFRLLDDAEMKILIDELYSQIELCSFDYPPEILHVFSVLLMYSKHGLICQTQDDVLVHALEYIEKICESKQLKEINIDLFSRNDCFGLGYAEKETSQFESIYTALVNAINKVSAEKMPDIATDIVDLLKSNPDLFVKKISRKHSLEDDGSYFDVPVFSLCSPREFLAALTELKNSTKYEIGEAIEARYYWESTNTKLIAELPFLSELSVLIAEVTSSQPSQLSKMAIVAIREHNIKKAIEQLSKIENTANR